MPVSRREGHLSSFLGAEVFFFACRARSISLVGSSGSAVWRHAIWLRTSLTARTKQVLATGKWVGIERWPAQYPGGPAAAWNDWRSLDEGYFGFQMPSSPRGLLHPRHIFASNGRLLEAERYPPRVSQRKAPSAIAVRWLHPPHLYASQARAWRSCRSGPCDK